MSRKLSRKENSSVTGKVFLVGAGPGDPELITAKGLSVLKKADVVVYDQLSSPVLLDEVPDTAEKIYVGKKAGHHTLPQEKINQLLVEKSRPNRVVVRLKGGDPFIFGRGGEEALYLKKFDVPFEVVPGVTAGVAALSYAGIPATMRGVDSCVTFATGHEDPTKNTTHIDWKSLAQGKGTLIFYMGVAQLPKIVDRLLDNGKPSETPVALVQNGTQPNQRVVEGTLATIATRARETRIAPPALIVVGDVVRLRKKLAWFEALPLKGKRMVVTRARHQAGQLTKQLRQLGADVIELPVIQILPPDSWKPADSLIFHKTRPDWIVFTSENGVNAFFGRLLKHNHDARWFGNSRIAVIGPGTATALQKYGLRPDVQPARFVAEGLVEVLLDQNIQGQQMALLRAQKTRDFLTEALTQAGAAVQEIPVYRTVPEVESRAKWEKQIPQTGVIPDWVLFTSSSTVENFHKILPSSEWAKIKNIVKFASIGPITTKTARELGLPVAVEAKEFTISGLIQAILEFDKERT